jgi:putative glycosyltransferase (TIGR04372 family)
MNFSNVIAHASAKFEFFRTRLQQQGIKWMAGRLIKRVMVGVGWFVLLPVTLGLHLIGYRRVTVITDRIGHVAAEMDCFLKEKALGRLPDRRWFVLAPPHRISNWPLLEYWRPHIRILTSPWLCGLLSSMTWWRGLMTFDVSHYVLRLNSTAAYFEVYAEWENRPPLLRLSREDHEKGRNILEAMGVPRDAWFICVQAREGGFSPLDEILHQHRNSDILKLVPAMEFIASRGGWCIRMGDPTTTPLPSLSKTIDYAHHSTRSEWMDVFLCASCRFFLGNSSGLSIVSSIFGVPCALANTIPLSYLSYSPQDVSIPKLLRRESDGCYISFEEIFKSPLADYRLAKLYQDAGVEIEENTAEEILELASEMLDRVEGKIAYDEVDMDLQRRFHVLLRPGHYGYGAASRIGAAFLRKHNSLLLSANTK